MTRNDRHCTTTVIVTALGLTLGATLVACDGAGGRPSDTHHPGAVSGLTGLDDGFGDTDGFGTGDTEGSGETDDMGAEGGNGIRFDLPPDEPPPPGGEDECAAVSAAAELVPLPADIIFVVDNSGSMGFEAGQIQAKMNDFSSQIIASGIDVHVVLLSSYPSNGNGICIAPPLGAGGCPGADTNAPTFTHVNQYISSHGAWQSTLSSHGQWSGAIREESVKHIVVVTDDTSSIGWQQFDDSFKALDPSYADYVHHSVVCHSNCASAAGIGNNYITLSNNTGGVAADLCAQDFQAVFDVLTTEVIGGSALACDFAIPPPPDGMEFDPDEVNLEFDDGMGGLLEIGRVDSAAACAGVADGWYYDNPSAPTTIVMCPQTCDTLQLSENGAINIQFGCATIPAG